MPPGLSKVIQFAVQTKAEHQVVQDRHIMASLSEREPGRIFMEGNISSAMQSILDAPIVSG